MAEDAGAAAAAAAAPEKVADAAAEVVEGEDEPAIPGATVQVLTEANFERLTQVSTGATTGDWFIGEWIRVSVYGGRFGYSWG